MLRIERRNGTIDLELSPDAVIAESALQVVARYLMEQDEADPTPLLQVIGELIRIGPPREGASSQATIHVLCERLEAGRYRVDVDVPGRDLRRLLLENPIVLQWCRTAEIDWRPSRVTLEVETRRRDATEGSNGAESPAAGSDSPSQGPPAGPE